MPIQYGEADLKKDKKRNGRGKGKGKSKGKVKEKVKEKVNPRKTNYGRAIEIIPPPLSFLFILLCTTFDQTWRLYKITGINKKRAQK